MMQSVRGKSSAGSAALGALTFDVDSIQAVIVNWNLAADTIVCVRSLVDAGLRPQQVTVVDNGSTDDSISQLDLVLGSDIHLLRSPTNVGFAAGNNLGIRSALQSGVEWIFLVNNDTFVQPAFFGQLASAFEGAPYFHLISPLILYAAEPDRIWSLGDRLLPGTLLTHSLWRNRHVPADLPPVVEVDFLTACALLVHRSVFERIGLLSMDYFMYAEDADFCWRARAGGARLACVTSARLWHKVSRSTGVHHPQSRYWRISNQIRFYRRYATVRQLVLLWGFTGLRCLKLIVQDSLLGRRVQAAATARAWRDGWYGNGNRQL